MTNKDSNIFTIVALLGFSLFIYGSFFIDCCDACQVFDKCCSDKRTMLLIMGAILLFFGTYIVRKFERG